MRRLVSVLSAATATMLALGALAAAPAQAAETGIDLQPESVQQSIDGFGFASALRRAVSIYNLPEPTRTEVLDLLFDRDEAAPSILRLGIGSAAVGGNGQMGAIQPTNPGGPAATPNYVWDGFDNGSFFVATEAQRRGVTQFYGDAWSAPGYMKSNNSNINGGQLCGTVGTNCASGDWKNAYADMLIEWANRYKTGGIDITHLNFVNEPDYAPNYESMTMSPAQAVDFVRTLGPKAEAAGVGLVFGESLGWEQGKAYWSALLADPEAAQYVDTLSAHFYASPSSTSFETDKKVWMSEFAASTTQTGWNENWDGGSGAVTDGIQMATHIQNTMTKSNASAYLWWLGSSGGATAALIQIDDSTKTYKVSSRFHTFSAFSRYIRPGAVRYDVAQSIDGLSASAYRNTDGTQVIQLLNTASTPISTDIDLSTQPTTYVTDNTHDFESVDTVATTTGSTTALELPARALVTLTIPSEDGGDSGDAIPVEAEVGESAGQLALTVGDYGDGVELAEGAAGDRLRYDGELPTLTVTDSRTAAQAAGGAWSLTGRSTDFAGPTETVSAANLGWTPSVTTPRDGVAAGEPVATALSGGPGLEQPATLASATPDGRLGSTDATAQLLLELPIDTAPGTYRATLSVSLFPTD